MLGINETVIFQRKAASLLTVEQLEALKEDLARTPTRGDVIKGTGGVRKLRIAARGHGKSGGARVIYYYHNDGYPLGLITIYGKGEKADLTAAEKRELRQLAARYTDAYDR